MQTEDMSIRDGAASCVSALIKHISPQGQYNNLVGSTKYLILSLTLIYIYQPNGIPYFMRVTIFQTAKLSRWSLLEPYSVLWNKDFAQRLSLLDTSQSQLSLNWSRPTPPILTSLISFLWVITKWRPISLRMWSTYSCTDVPELLEDWRVFAQRVVLVKYLACGSCFHLLTRLAVWCVCGVVVCVEHIRSM